MYRMSLGESFLVLIIIGLWLFSVLNLARKLERICNPPSTYPNYSVDTKTSLRRSTIIHERFAQPQQLIRATSEPMIDASPRTTIYIRSPSETFLHAKSPISEHIPSPATLELGESTSLLNLLGQSDDRIHGEKRIPSARLLNPRRIPSIVRRSLLDLHRRALMSSSSPNTFKTRCIVTTIENQTLITTNRFKKTYQREHTIDEDNC